MVFVRMEYAKKERNATVAHLRFVAIMFYFFQYEENSDCSDNILESTLLCGVERGDLLSGTIVYTIVQF